MAHEHKIRSVEEGGIAWEMGIEPGDKLLTVNGQEIEDIFDYRYYIEEEELLLLIEKADGEQWELEIGKEEYEDLGICLLYTSEKDQSCDRPRISGGL